MCVGSEEPETAKSASCLPFSLGASRGVAHQDGKSLSEHLPNAGIDNILPICYSVFITIEMDGFGKSLEGSLKQNQEERAAVLRSNGAPTAFKAVGRSLFL